MLFGSKESPTPARPMVEGSMILRGSLRLKRAGGFDAELIGDLHSTAAVQILPGSRITGRVTGADEIVLHEGSAVRGPLEARALDLHEGAVFSGMVRIGPDAAG